MRLLLFVVLAVVAGCMPTLSPLSGAAPRRFHEHVRLHGYDLTLHLTAAQPHDSPLILYATGDGGWWDQDKAIFRTLSTWGYPAVGVSAPEYVDHLGDGDTTSDAEEVAADFAAIVSTAETALGLPATTPVVLVGLSRGAGLAVAAGSASSLDGHLLGILAVGLTREEENVAAPLSDAHSGDSPAPLETYETLPSLGPIPVAVIQSTRDEYVPAAEARDLFGPDTASRRLRAIDSEDHSFEGARPALDRELQRSFQWIVRR